MFGFRPICTAQSTPGHEQNTAAQYFKELKLQLSAQQLSKVLTIAWMQPLNGTSSFAYGKLLD